MSVLAHIVSRSLRPEPAATQALEYILKHPPALDAFMGVFEPTGVNFDPRNIASEIAHGEGRPDLTVYDSKGQGRLFVENKFWAGLTPAQPVEYLTQLPEDETASGLVFIVPEDRVPTIWAELTRRCDEADLLIEEEGQNSAMRSARFSGKRAMVVVDWKRVLGALGAIESVRSDVRQLRALTDRVNSDAFLPVRGEELTNIDLPRRLINYSDLVEQIVNELKARGVADTNECRPAHGYHEAGRYLHIRDRLGFWLGVSLVAWRESGTTPLWLRINEAEWSGVSHIWQEIDGLFDNVQTFDSNKFLPIHVKVGVVREKVVAAAADQMEAIAQELLNHPPL